jgi:uncharacterized protein (TIGR02996 family)
MSPGREVERIKEHERMTERDWEALLDREPDTADLRLQYSDWLEEQGLLDRAEVQRWLARTGKRPNPTGIDWEWWREGESAVERGIAPHRMLPAVLFNHLPAKPAIPSQDWPYPPDKKQPGDPSRVGYRTYSTRQAAEEALVRAWSSLKKAGGSLP